MLPPAMKVLQYLRCTVYQVQEIPGLQFILSGERHFLEGHHQPVAGRQHYCARQIRIYGLSLCSNNKSYQNHQHLCFEKYLQDVV